MKYKWPTYSSKISTWINVYDHQRTGISATNSLFFLYFEKQFTAYFGMRLQFLLLVLLTWIIIYIADVVNCMGCLLNAHRLTILLFYAEFAICLHLLIDVCASFPFILKLHSWNLNFNVKFIWVKPYVVVLSRRKILTKECFFFVNTLGEQKHKSGFKITREIENPLLDCAIF